MLPSVRDSAQTLEDLKERLTKALDTKKGGSRRTVHKVKGLEIASWKFQEYDYAKNLVPCKARGLFTIDSQIVVRGYDKFFNVGEVVATKPSELEKNTKGPYDITVKENGCIIFIGGLEDGTIVVCSKHSTGARDDLTRNHAVEGENQLKKQLESQGKLLEQLAKTLYTHNVTLVAELCDDDFEEHILAYKHKDAGLYLHGINFNTAAFKTYPMNEVGSFASEWGFKCVESFQIPTFKELFAFLDDCKLTGTWKGREIEGFVVRTSVGGEDFFFKFKFDQPYLLYRKFREVTKLFLRGTPYNNILKRYKDEKYIIARYISFVTKYFVEHPEKKEAYLDNHGVIELRKQFLFSCGLNEISGMSLLEINEQLASTMKFEPVTKKYVLIPVATVGCGKTTVAGALQNLFGWGHIQNDNLPHKGKGKNLLVLRCLENLITSSVVICDRNNHLKRERQQLFDQFYQHAESHLPVEVELVFIALDFVPFGTDKTELKQVTLDRIVKRGDNHQSIKSSTDPELASKILDGFVGRLQYVNQQFEPDNGFDLVIDLNYKADSVETVKLIINTLVSKFPEIVPQIPSDSEVVDAVDKAVSYVPTFTKTFNTKTKKQRLRVDYFGVRIFKEPLLSLLDEVCGDELRWQQLKQSNRLKEEFHVTLAHSSLLKSHSTEWGQLHELIDTKSQKNPKSFEFCPILATVTLHSVVLTDRLICVEAELSDFEGPDISDIKVPVLNERPHITIGTFAPEIKPVESNSVLKELAGVKPSGSNLSHKLSDGTSATVILVNQRLEGQPLFAHFQV